mmetsp:Transcript_131897/g.312649  ORF Transcript_131897/g.312649 Transcript_131897/m.312649 type:complete len:238 (+) Transcript_131897:58-771(+)
MAGAGGDSTAVGAAEATQGRRALQEPSAVHGSHWGAPCHQRRGVVCSAEVAAGNADHLHGADYELLGPCPAEPHLGGRLPRAPVGPLQGLQPPHLHRAPAPPSCTRARSADPAAPLPSTLCATEGIEPPWLLAAASAFVGRGCHTAQGGAACGHEALAPAFPASGCPISTCLSVGKIFGDRARSWCAHCMWVRRLSEDHNINSARYSGGAPEESRRMVDWKGQSNALLDASPPTGSA